MSSIEDNGYTIFNIFLLKIVVREENDLSYATRESFSGSAYINPGSNTGNLSAKAYGKRLVEGDGNTSGEESGFCFIAMPNNYSAFPV
jgi:hypothetical protein